MTNHELRANRVILKALRRWASSILRIPVDLLYYDNSPATFEDNDLVPKWWVVQQVSQVGSLDPLQVAINTATPQPITPPSGYSLSRVMVEYPDPSRDNRLVIQNERMSKDYVAGVLYVDVYDSEILTLTWF